LTGVFTSDEERVVHGQPGEGGECGGRLFPDLGHLSRVRSTHPLSAQQFDLFVQQHE